MGSGKIKVKAQVFITHQDKVLVYRVKDETTGTHIYRLIGGRVEFGELSEKAALREFVEETGLSVEPIKLLGIFESLFKIHGKLKHELVHIYHCEFKDKSHYSKQTIPLVEPGEVLNSAQWIERKVLLHKDTPFYPQSFKLVLAQL
jgi:ADP-ribose pyrophosphatase YjhB (NUDIX family)